MDLFTNNVAIVGTRTGGKGGRYLIAGPGWNGTPPPQTTVLRSPTNDAWLLVRVLVNGTDDLATATGLIRGFSLEVPPTMPSRTRTNAVPVSVPDAATFIAVVDEAAGAQPAVGKRHPAAARIDRPRASSPGGRRRRTSLAALGQGRSRRSVPRSSDRSGAGGHRRSTAGATPAPASAHYGDSDDAGPRPRRARRPRRAAADRGDLPDRGRRQGRGAADRGAGLYRRTSPATLPVGAFWSLTMYRQEADGRLFFVDTPVEALRRRRPHPRPARRTRRRLRHLRPADRAVGRARGQLAAVAQGPFRPDLPRLSARPGAARRQSPPAAGRAERPHPVTAGQCAGSGAVAVDRWPVLGIGHDDPPGVEQHRPAPVAIDRIAGDRRAETGGVDPDPACAPGLGPELDQAALPRSRTRQCVTAFSGPSGIDDHPPAGRGARDLGQRRVDRALRRPPGAPSTTRPIGLGHPARSEQRRQPLEGFRVAGEHEAARWYRGRAGAPAAAARTKPSRSAIRCASRLCGVAGPGWTARPAGLSRIEDVRVDRHDPPDEVVGERRGAACERPSPACGPHPQLRQPPVARRLPRLPLPRGRRSGPCARPPVGAQASR